VVVEAEVAAGVVEEAGVAEVAAGVVEEAGVAVAVAAADGAAAEVAAVGGAGAAGAAHGGAAALGRDLAVPGQATNAIPSNPARYHPKLLPVAPGAPQPPGRSASTGVPRQRSPDRRPNPGRCR
jgi:hypothetical protein